MQCSSAVRSIVSIIQLEKRTAYKCGAVIGLLGKSLPAEITAKISEDLTIKNGVSAAEKNQAAHSSERQYMIDGVIKIGKF